MPNGRSEVAPLSMLESNGQRPPLITADTLLTTSSQQVSCDVSGETVILSLKNAVYYGLDPVATRIWELFKDRRTIAQVCEVLLAEYDGVEAERCESEVIALTEQLVEWELVEVMVSPSLRVTSLA